VIQNFIHDKGEIFLSSILDAFN